LADELTYTFNIDGTSDYVFRGFSQSGRQPAVQGGADFAYNIFYAGIWASSINFGTVQGGVLDADPALGSNIADAEVDLYGGIAPIWKNSPFGDVTFNLGFIYYWYPGSKPFPDAINGTNSNIDYLEGKAGYSVAWKQIKGLTTGETIYYSGDGTFNTGRYWILESTASYTLPNWGPISPSISGTWGYDQGQSNDAYFLHAVGNGKDHYQYWNAGVTFTADKISLDLRYWDTDIKDDNAAAADSAGAFGNKFCTGKVAQCDANFVATVKVVLP
jgi:uncharacterized protein (TIGR02001 family)